jgi:UDP-N-acetylmuramyl tripeptide synthase
MSKTSLFIGKTIRRISRLRGGGSALPGLVVEKIDKNFLQRTLSHLPHGIVVVSGTNGKTTTTKMVVELLESQNLRVFTNSTGSNFKRGIISSVIEESSLSSKLSYDIAVLELDEAHAVHFIKDVAPNYCLLLNVMRDQLDRFGEIDTTANMLEKIASATKKHIVVNREDERIVEFIKKIDIPTTYYGLSSELRKEFPTDDELYSNQKKSLSHIHAQVVLDSIKNHTAYFDIDEKIFKSELKINGLYNVFNAAGAIALVKVILGDKLDNRALFHKLSQITPAFGRGESLKIGNRNLEIILVKNPAGFRLGIKSFNNESVDIMIAINDNYADGRDMSWLWDVDFSDMKKNGVLMVGGTRSYDMALRLKYDEIALKHMESNLKKSLKHFIETSSGNMRIFCTYTAMLSIREELKKYTKVERVL